MLIRNCVSFLSTTSPISEPWTLASAMWTVAFTVILVIAIIGNCGVLWIILGVSAAKINSTPPLAILITSCCSTPRHVDRHQLLPSLPDRLRPSHHHHPDDTLLHLYERQGSSYRVITLLPGNILPVSLVTKSCIIIM